MGAGFVHGGLVNKGCFALLRFWLICGILGLGEICFARGPAPAADMASLPMVLPDDMGVRWDVQQDGSISDGGNDLYDGGGHLHLNETIQWTSGRNARFDRERN